MKQDKQWQKPDLSVMKQRNAKKVIGSSSKGNVRYSTGIGPTPPAPTPVPPGYPDLVQKIQGIGFKKSKFIVHYLRNEYGRG